MNMVWKVGIYARVSTDKKQQQESIPAQVQSLEGWIKDKNLNDIKFKYEVIDVYEDFGFSGSNFERDSFMRMIGDIEIGRINMILTRDLSRFGRNYISAGYYLEDYFRVNGVRFVSVLDNVDTIQEINDIIPFKNILNEMYIKDCSRRIKDGLKQRMIRGSSIASKPPYGYEFEETYKNGVKNIGLISKEDESTRVVELIFNRYIEGWGFGRIASYLNQKKIPSPSLQITSEISKWTNGTIKYILTNPKYAGIMVQGRWRKVSYKLKKVVQTDKTEWIYGDEFKGIIDKDIFYKVQSIMENRSGNYRYKGENMHLFSSVLKCTECGGKFTYRHNYRGYKCINSQKGGGVCTSHSIKEEYLLQVITENLRQQVDNHILKEKFYKQFIPNNLCSIDKVKRLKLLENKFKKLNKQLQKVYEDRENNIINEHNFYMLIQNIQNQQESLFKMKQEINMSTSDGFEEDNYERYKNIIDEILDFKELDRNIVEMLIDRIEVSEDIKTKEKKINIYFKFNQIYR